MSARANLAARFSRGSVRRLATRALVGGLGRRATRRLGDALRGSERDRRAYGRLAELYRTLESSPDLSSGQHDRILAALRAGVAAEAGRSPATGRGLLSPALAGTIAAAAVLVIALVGPPVDLGGLAPRGRAAIPAAGRIGLKAFCVRGGRVLPPPPEVAGLDARCRPGDELQLVVTHSASFSHLLVVGLMPGEEARELYYFPVPPDGRSGPAPRNAVDAALGRAVRLEVNHRPGPLRIVALFSSAPLEAGQVHGWLRALAHDEPAPPLLARLAPSVETVELRVAIEAGPASRRSP
jgi:hypothetical protein